MSPAAAGKGIPTPVHKTVYVALKREDERAEAGSMERWTGVSAPKATGEEVQVPDPERTRMAQGRVDAATGQAALYKTMGGRRD